MNQKMLEQMERELIDRRLELEAAAVNIETMKHCQDFRKTDMDEREDKIREREMLLLIREMSVEQREKALLTSRMYALLLKFAYWPLCFFGGISKLINNLYNGRLFGKEFPRDRKKVHRKR